MNGMASGSGLQPSVQLHHSVMSDSLWPHGLQHSSCPVHHQLLKLAQTHVHLKQWCRPTISSSFDPFSCIDLSQHQNLFHRVSSSQQVAKGLEFQLKNQSFQWIFMTDFLLDGLVGSPCSPRDSQESSPAPQFKSISSSALSFLYTPTFTSIHDHWKNHSLD